MLIKNNNKGFTLIESLLYLVLFTIIIGGGMIAVYQIIQSTNATNDKVVIQEEANFLLQKLDWALAGAKLSDITSMSSIAMTVRGQAFVVSGGNITLNAEILNSSFVKIAPVDVTTPIFDQPSGTKILKIIFTVNNQRFNATKYLY